MNRKIFIGLFVISLIVFAGGCGGSSHSVTGSTDVNTALNGAWTSSSDGTASLTNADNSDELADVEAWIGAFEEELPDDVQAQYEEEKAKLQENKIDVPVTSAMALFEDCNVKEENGTAKFTAIVILSNDSFSLPVFYNGVAISTQRNGTNEWTATTPDGDTLSITMVSEEKINLSGEINYLDYVCEFSTVINKNTHNSISPQTILDGTWNLDGDQGGGYLAVDSKVAATIVPEAVSMHFKDTKEEASALTSNVSSFYSLYMKTSNTEGNDEASVLQIVNPASGETLTKVYDNVYRFTGTNGEGIVFVENTDEIFVFMAETEDNAGQTCMFLPLKKAGVDLEAAMNKTWTAFDGGGYVKVGDISNPDNDPEIEFIKLLDTFSFTLQNATLSFSDINMNDDDDTVTASMNLNTSFSLTNSFLASLGLSQETVNISETAQFEMTRSGNFLQFHDYDTTYNLSFISDTEAFLSIISNEQASVEGEFVLRFKAN